MNRAWNNCEAGSRTVATAGDLIVPQLHAVDHFSSAESGICCTEGP